MSRTIKLPKQVDYVSSNFVGHWRDLGKNNPFRNNFENVTARRRRSMFLKPDPTFCNQVILYLDRCLFMKFLVVHRLSTPLCLFSNFFGLPDLPDEGRPKFEAFTVDIESPNNKKLNGYSFPRLRKGSVRSDPSPCSGSALQVGNQVNDN
jgi:hypothetical protein